MGFKANLKKIEEHNATPGHTWTMAVTQFADLTQEEFKTEVLGGYIKTPQSGNHPSGADENIESYAAINNVSLTKLSAQEITTCTPNPMHCGGTGGCRGSIPQLGYNYVQ